MTSSNGNAHPTVFRSDIEGLRALAILLVVASHADVPWLAGGFIGVDVFFVLSGFLITGLLLREFNGSGSINLADFYARRLRRLLPGLLLMVVCVGLAASKLTPPLEHAWQAQTAGMAAFWISNFHFAFEHLEYFGPEVSSNLFLHTWSLGVEEQFYLVWPVFLLFLLGAWGWQGRLRDTRRLMHGLIATLFLCLVLSMFLTVTRPAWGFYLMPSRAWQFALGALALLWCAARAPGEDGMSGLRFGPRMSLLLSLLGWAGFALIVASALVFDRSVAYPGWRAVIPGVGTVAILVAGARTQGGSLSAVLSVSPMQALGRWSYSWYLWHWPVLLLGGTLILVSDPINRLLLVALSLILAILSYVLVERPVRINAGLAARPVATLLGGVLLMLLVSGASWQWRVSAAGWSATEQQQRYSEIRDDRPVLYSMGCDEWFHSARVYPCGFGDPNASRTAVLMGDSIVGQWFPAIAERYTRSGWRLIVLTKSSCPMVDEPYFYGRIGRRYLECEQWREQALQVAADIAPDVLILGSGLSYPFDEAGWVEGSRRVLGVVAPVSGKVLIVRATHPLGFDGPSCLAARDWRAPVPSSFDACETEAGGNEHELRVFGWLNDAAAAFENVHAVDFNPLVCPQGLCAAQRDGMIVYRDGTHLSAAYVASLAARVQQIIDDVAPSGADTQHRPDAGSGG
jgi:peptidoglycan/LPS O-acetylase OafA/YrhL